MDKDGKEKDSHNLLEDTYEINIRADNLRDFAITKSSSASSSKKTGSFNFIFPAYNFSYFLANSALSRSSLYATVCSSVFHFVRVFCHSFPSHNGGCLFHMLIFFS